MTQFQNTSADETREKILANLANFAYDPYNYNFLRQVGPISLLSRKNCTSLTKCTCIILQLNVLELFIDCLTEPNEKLVEFGIGGICNSCVGNSSDCIFSDIIISACLIVYLIDKNYNFV